MTLKKLKVLIEQNACRFIGVGNYTMQIYADAKRGNIKRIDETVLCAFDLLEDEIRIAPAKVGYPFEFGYEYLSIGIEEKVNSISKLPNKHAKELGEVFNNFAQTLNNMNLEKKLQ